MTKNDFSSDIPQYLLDNLKDLIDISEKGRVSLVFPLKYSFLFKQILKVQVTVSNLA